MLAQPPPPQVWTAGPLVATGGATKWCLGVSIRALEPPLEKGGLLGVCRLRLAMHVSDLRGSHRSGRSRGGRPAGGPVHGRVGEPGASPRL